MYQMAAQLARIHGSDCANLDTSFLPDQTERYNRTFSNRPAKVDDSLDEERIRDALEPAWPWPRRNKLTFLHGDFWPGNLLWREEQLVGVIDWEDANFGDPLADIAISRLEILWEYGIHAMHSFTRHYQSLTSLNFTNLSYWDLCAALRPAFHIDEWAGEPTKAQLWRKRHKVFVTLALERLSSRS
jgi:aminoglycoside phosphotransferase (APT) family kinase protein